MEQIIWTTEKRRAEELSPAPYNPRKWSDKDTDVPEARTTDIKLGDIFKLGEHRLLCGDSTKKSDVR